MKEQKGFIQIPLLITIIAGVLIIGVGSYVIGIKQHQKTITESIIKTNATQSGDLISPKIGETAPTQKTTITTLNPKPASSIRYIKNTTNLYDFVVNESGIGGNKALKVVKTLSRGTQIRFIQVGNGDNGKWDDWSKISVDNQEGWVFNHDLVSDEPSARNLSAVIKQWRPLVAYVECDFRDLNTHELYSQVRGSGVIVDFDSQITVITNRHIIADKNNYQPFTCRIKLPDSSNTFTGNKFTGGGPLLDVGFIDISNPNTYIQYITSASSPSSLNQCKNKPAIGDSVLVLGYPVIGSQTDITATEGIISGYDGDYYITSAKIDQGNSGGAAILVNDNCYLGIPSASVVGQIESLGRILDVRVMRGER